MAQTRDEDDDTPEYEECRFSQWIRVTYDTPDAEHTNTGWEPDPREQPWAVNQTPQANPPGVRVNRGRTIGYFDPVADSANATILIEVCLHSAPTCPCTPASMCKSLRVTIANGRATPSTPKLGDSDYTLLLESPAIFNYPPGPPVRPARR